MFPTFGRAFNIIFMKFCVNERSIKLSVYVEIMSTNFLITLFMMSEGYPVCCYTVLVRLHDNTLCLLLYLFFIYYSFVYYLML